MTISSLALPLFVLCCSIFTQATSNCNLPDLPNPCANPVTINNGALIIPMDLRQQTVSDSWANPDFNLMAYGKYMLYERVKENAYPLFFLNSRRSGHWTFIQQCACILGDTSRKSKRWCRLYCQYRSGTLSFSSSLLSDIFALEVLANAFRNSFCFGPELFGRAFHHRFGLCCDCCANYL